jgi:hypothetical protein
MGVPSSITEPSIEQVTWGGRQDRPCIAIRMYGNECKVSGEDSTWFIEAPFAYMGHWDVWAKAESRDAALVLAGEYLRERRDHDMHQ